MHVTMELGPLPEQFRKVIANAERQAHRAYADALNHEDPHYDEIAARFHAAYTELCEQVAVCYAFGCFERTDLDIYCLEHKKEATHGR